MATSPGRAAYEKWCECINPPQLPKQHALRIQPWGELKPKTKDTWDAVAQAAIKADRRSVR